MVTPKDNKYVDQLINSFGPLSKKNPDAYDILKTSILNKFFEDRQTPSSIKNLADKIIGTINPGDKENEN